MATCQVKECYDGYAAWVTVDLHFDSLTVQNVGMWLCRDHTGEMPVDRFSIWESKEASE